MSAQHTPGPWYSSQHGTAWVLAGDPKDSYNHVVSIPFTDGRDGPVLPKAEQDANARLIAAAPELLEALDNMVRVFDRGLPAQCIGRTFCDHAIAAIAKARGTT